MSKNFFLKDAIIFVLLNYGADSQGFAGVFLFETISNKL